MDKRPTDSEVEAAIALLKKGWLVTDKKGYLAYPDGFDEAIQTVICALAASEKRMEEVLALIDSAISHATQDDTIPIDHPTSAIVVNGKRYCSNCGRKLKGVSTPDENNIVIHTYAFTTGNRASDLEGEDHD